MPDQDQQLTARQRIDAGWQELLTCLDGIPDARLAEPGAAGEWSVKDLLGHIAFWEGAAVRRVARIVNDEPHPPGQDYEPINQRERAARADWSAAEALQELLDTHAQLLAAFDGAPRVDPADFESSTWGHYAEHVADIRAWRERAGL